MVSGCPVFQRRNVLNPFRFEKAPDVRIGETTVLFPDSDHLVLRHVRLGERFTLFAIIGPPRWAEGDEVVRLSLGVESKKPVQRVPLGVAIKIGHDLPDSRYGCLDLDRIYVEVLGKQPAYTLRLEGIEGSGKTTQIEKALLFADEIIFFIDLFKLENGSRKPFFIPGPAGVMIRPLISSAHGLSCPGFVFRPPIPVIRFMPKRNWFDGTRSFFYHNCIPFAKKL